MAGMANLSHLLVRAARGEPVERSPVWAMRQAGRWDPEFNRVRAGLSFYEFSENVDRAAEASLEEIARSARGIVAIVGLAAVVAAPPEVRKLASR